MNDIEIYKISYSHVPSTYYIYEYKDNVLTKLTLYVNNIKSSETTYYQPDNKSITDRLPDFTLYTSKSFDSDENLESLSQYVPVNETWSNFEDALCKIDSEQIINGLNLFELKAIINFQFQMIHSSYHSIIQIHWK